MSDQASKRGDQAITACALIHHMFGDEIEVLLAKRSDSKQFLPGVYEMPGGHLEFGEDIVAGLRREILEELGVRIHVGDPFGAFTYVNDITATHSVEVVFFATLVDHLSRVHVNSHNHSVFRFVNEREAQDINPMSANERKCLMRGFALLGGSPRQIT